MVDMYIYNVDVTAHNEMEETLIYNTAIAIDILGESYLYDVDCNYDNAYTRLKVLKEVGIITEAEFEYLTDYIIMIWKKIKRKGK